MFLFRLHLDPNATSIEFKSLVPFSWHTTIHIALSEFKETINFNYNLIMTIYNLQYDFSAFFRDTTTYSWKVINCTSTVIQEGTWLYMYMLLSLISWIMGQSYVYCWENCCLFTYALLVCEYIRVAVVLALIAICTSTNLNKLRKALLCLIYVMSPNNSLIPVYIILFLNYFIGPEWVCRVVLVRRHDMENYIYLTMNYI